MKARKMIVSVLAASLVAGGSALAYAGQNEGCSTGDRADKRVARMAQHLELDEAQTTSLKELFAKRAEQRPEHPRQPMKGLAQLDPNAADYNEQVKAQIADMQQKLAERVQSRADFKAELYAILTPEQEQKLAEMRDQRGEKHRDGKHMRGDGPHHRQGGPEKGAF